MEYKLSFPKLEETAGLCFVRKYRNEGKTRYVFYKANIKIKIAEELKQWLSDNIKLVQKLNLKEYTLENFKEADYIDLDTIDNWKFFKKSAFDMAFQEVTDLEMIKKDLIAFIVYIKLKDIIVGQIRKLTPSSLLDKKGFYALFLDDATFNELKEQKGVEIDKGADLVFKFTSQKSEGVILNKYNFNGIFDIYLQMKRDSIKVLKSCKLLYSHKEGAEIIKTVEEDRIIQRMLLNPLVKQHLNEIDFDTIKELKKEIPDRVSFDVDETLRQIIFPEKERKAAIHDLIKVISYRISRSLDAKHLLEGTPERILK